MKSTLEIFPHNYIDMPSNEDIAIMLEDILQRADNVNTIVYKIQQEPCPYYQEALILLLNDQLKDFYHKRDERFGYYRQHDWIPYWQNRNEEIKKLLHQCERLQTQSPPSPVKELPAQIEYKHQHDSSIDVQRVADKLKVVLQQTVSDIKEYKDSMHAFPITINVHVSVAGDLVDVKGNFIKRY
jgi:hypothetical protein